MPPLRRVRQSHAGHDPAPAIGLRVPRGDAQKFDAGLRIQDEEPKLTATHFNSQVAVFLAIAKKAVPRGVLLALDPEFNRGVFKVVENISRQFDVAVAAVELEDFVLRGGGEGAPKRAKN